MTALKAVALALLVAMAGCASGLDKARVTITTAVKVEGDVEDGVLSAVEAEQTSLLSQVNAGKLAADQAEAQYASFRAKVVKVASALTLLHDALKTAAHAVDTADALGSKDYGAAMADVASAFASVIQALTDAGVHVTGVN